MDEEDRILERERLQMEQIRELDFEELQVEEVDEFRDSEEDDDLGISHHTRLRLLSDNIVGADDEHVFNPDVASLHTYLGEVEDTPNRTAFVDGGTVLKIPLFYLEGVVLFPDSTLPLRIVQSTFLAAIERALNQPNAPCTIGVIRVYREGNQFKYATVGTTAEIRQYRRLSDGSFNVITRGQQRFLLKRRWTDVEGFPCGEVHIVEEDVPLRTPRDAFGKLVPISNSRASSTMALSASFSDTDEMSVANSEESFESALSPSEKKLHYSAVDSIMDDWTCSDDEDEVVSTSNIIQSADGKTPVSKGKCQKLNRLTSFRKNTDLNRFRMAPRAFWPFWVYRMYDSYHLAQRAADLWKQIVGVPNMEAIVNKPDILSFSIASKIPVSESIRQELLEIDGVSYRLRVLIVFDVNTSVVARRSDMLVMSSDGPLGAYVNPHGYVHEIMTFYKANDIAISGRSVKEDSWFPGYAWTIANCATCETQLGWLFTATSNKLKPSSFWAVRSSQVADDMR
ncbi:hypothetical protein HID58_082862 [Brassica napus]|uniref:Protein cereblon n=1 Tax=Brassica napus TaxID=3708 RepID=A0ABQ7YBX0_BRANA|nr:hypothetical protein HID58_082862 [Brassica napus]